MNWNTTPLSKEKTIYKQFEGSRWWRPASVGRYVYFNNLATYDEALYKVAHDKVNLMGKQNKGEVEQQIKEAMDFLYQAMLNERAKENNFILFHKKELPLIDQSNYIQDGEKLLLEINKAILGVDNLRQIVDHEMTAKKQKDARAEAMARKVEKSKLPQYTRSFTQKYQESALPLLNMLAGRGGTMDAKNMKIYKMVVNAIYENVGANITSMSNEALFTTVLNLGVSAKEAVKEMEEFGYGDFMKSREFASIIENLKKAYDNKKDLQKIQEYDKKRKQFFRDLGFTTAQMGDQGVGVSERESNAIETFLDGVPQRMRDRLSSMKDFSQKITILTKKGISEEVLTTEVFDALGSLLGAKSSAYHTGKTGTATDVLVEVSVDNERSSLINEALEEVLSQSLYAPHDMFIKQNKKIQKKYSEMRKQLDNSSKGLHDLQKSFILHNNIKDYSSIGTEWGKSFKGGSWTLAPFMTYLQSLSGLGFAPQDTRLIEFAIMNSVPQAVGREYKSSLEGYLSIFIAMTLFSDGITMAREIASGMLANSTSLNVLHLFRVNKLFVPASYVLEIIYNQLQKGLANISDAGAKATITGGIRNPYSYLGSITHTENPIIGKARWTHVRNEEIESLRIQVQLLGNFFDIINSLDSMLD